MFSDQLPEVTWTDNFHQGYVRVVLYPDSAKASYVAVSTVLSPIYNTRTIKAFDIQTDGENLVLRQA